MIIKKIIAFMGVLIGALLIFFTAVINKVVTGIDIETINMALNYVPNIEAIDEEISLILTLIKINEYSHWIITLSIILIIICVFLWEASRRNKNE